MNKQKKLNKTRQKIKNKVKKYQPVSGGGKPNTRKDNKKIIKILLKILEQEDLQYLNEQ